MSKALDHWVGAKGYTEDKTFGEVADRLAGLEIVSEIVIQGELVDEVRTTYMDSLGDMYTLGYQVRTVDTPVDVKHYSFWFKQAA